MALVYTLVKLLLMRLGKTKMYLTDVFMASGEEMSQNMIPMGVSCHQLHFITRCYEKGVQ